MTLCWPGRLNKFQFQCLKGQKIMLGCRLLGGSVPKLKYLEFRDDIFFLISRNSHCKKIAFTKHY